MTLAIVWQQIIILIVILECNVVIHNDSSNNWQQVIILIVILECSVVIHNDSNNSLATSNNFDRDVGMQCSHP